MSTKHFINDPTHLVLSSLHSITYTNPTTAFDAENKVLYLRPDATPPQVSLISGGGSGHEPSFASFVGPGLLSAAVAGTIFASPAAEQIRRCILQRVDKTRGVLVVVMNYTGDVLNFGMAVEKAKAAGIEVEMIVVADDAGVGREKGGKVGRRGIAGTVVVLKIAGALAARGARLDEVHKAAKLVAENTVSIGSSLEHVHVPGREAGKGDEGGLGEGEVEIGMGIHNEPGSERRMGSFQETVKVMLKHMLDQSDKDRAFLKIDSSEPVVLLINNLGGVSVLELGGITSEVVAQLGKDYGIKPKRVLAGTFMTSLNGNGFSITLTKAVQLGVGHDFLSLLDAPVEAAGWSAPISTRTWNHPPSGTQGEESELAAENKPSGFSIKPSQVKESLSHALNKVVEAEPEVTKYDTVVGDGDCGTGLKRGAEGLLQALSKMPSSSTEDAATFMDKVVVPTIERDMDGTSGALYSIFLNALAGGLRQQEHEGEKPADAKVWATALQTAMKSLAKYTPAKPGDRTLIDALAPFIDVLAKDGDVHEAASAAMHGADKTKGMKASLGRSVYVGGSGFEEVPDPGAYGLAVFLNGLSESL